MSVLTFPSAALFTVLTVAAVSDFKRRRISNNLILVGWLIGISWHLFAARGAWAFDPDFPGSAGAFGGIAGAFVLLLAFIPFYKLRVMGAGDVKLMSVVGAFFGASTEVWDQLIGVSLFVLAAGGVLALLRMACSGSGANVFANLRLILVGLVGRLHGASGPEFDPRTDSADRMPYAIAIALGTFAYLLGAWSGWIRLS